MISRRGRERELSEEPNWPIIIATLICSSLKADKHASLCVFLSLAEARKLRYLPNSLFNLCRLQVPPFFFNALSLRGSYSHLEQFSLAVIGDFRYLHCIYTVKSCPSYDRSRAPDFAEPYGRF